MNSSLATHVASSLPWYLVRAFGLSSVVLLVLLVLLGIGLITGHTFRIWPPIKAWAVHRAIGITFGVSVFFHIFFLLLDRYVSYSLIQVLVPGLVSFWFSAGIIAMYVIAIIIITSLTIMDSKKRTWKSLHLLSYGAIILVFFHALNLGTDLRSGPLRVLWIIFGIILAIGMIIRLTRAGATKVISRQKD